MEDYIYNSGKNELYRVYRYMDGEICTDIRLIDTYHLNGNGAFVAFDVDAFWASVGTRKGA
jgi:hypothetical protein